MVPARESETSKLCSFARAYHSMLGKNKIFDDHLAYDMIGPEEYHRIMGLLLDMCSEKQSPVKYGFESLCVFDEMNRYFSPITLSRLAFAERALKRFAQRHSENQYVILGAGMDTFAFRNSDEAIEVFEMDHPDTQSYKLSRIHELHWKIPFNVHFSPVDFEKEDFGRKLLHSGFSPTEKSFFSLLGVSYYLSKESLASVIRTVGALSQSGSQFVFDFPDETTFSPKVSKNVRRLTEITRSLGEPMLHGFSLDEVRKLLNAEGFKIRIHESPDDIQRHYFEGRIDDQSAMENIHYLLAEKM